MWTGYEFPCNCIQCYNHINVQKANWCFRCLGTVCWPKANLTLKPYFSCALKVRRNAVVLSEVHFECLIPILSLAKWSSWGRGPKWNKSHGRQTQSSLSPGRHATICTAVAVSTNQSQALIWGMIANLLNQLTLSGVERCFFSIFKHDSPSYSLIFHQEQRLRILM